MKIRTCCLFTVRKFYFADVGHAAWWESFHKKSYEWGKSCPREFACLTGHCRARNARWSSISWSCTGWRRSQPSDPWCPSVHCRQNEDILTPLFLLHRVRHLQGIDILTVKVLSTFVLSAVCDFDAIGDSCFEGFLPQSNLSKLSRNHSAIVTLVKNRSIDKFRPQSQVFKRLSRPYSRYFV